jgi:alpha-1,3-glucosyltransferase
VLFSLTRFFQLAGITLFVFLASFGPFWTHIPQILSRLFPFKRGLLHSYWAPNFWAFYSFTDRLLLKLFSWNKTTASLTRGIVGDVQFGVLPDIQPWHTLLLTVAAQLPILIQLWKKPTPMMFMKSLILCGYASFLLGWHGITFFL